MNGKILVYVMLALPLTAQAFSWQRQIEPGASGPQRLEVDLALLGASRAGLADLRLQDAAGREVPYVLVPPDQAAPAWGRARLLPLAPDRTTSGLELDLGRVVKTARLRLDGIPAPFLKRFRLEGSGDRQRWTRLVEQGSLFDLPEEGLQRLAVDFPEGEYRYLRVVWDDRSSARLAMPRAGSVALAGSGQEAPHRVPLDVQKRPSEPGVSRFALRLPGPDIPLRALVLEVAGSGPLLREAQVVEPSLQTGGLAPRVLGQATLKRTRQGDATATDLRIPVAAPAGSELDLRVEDGSNPGLELTGIQAELAPQPWIYFERQDGGAITARCGDPKLQAPRYDLEALRDKLQRSRAQVAHWGPGLPAPVPASLPGVPGAGLDGARGTALDASGFRFRRPVPLGAPGWTALVLDAQVLAHSPGLADLRLLDPQRRQVPYLLEQRDEPLSLALPIPPGRAQASTTLYTLTLPQAGLPAARLVFETDLRVFSRRLRVREDAEGGGPRPLADVSWTHQDPETAVPPLVLSLPALQTSRLTLEVDEGDNQPLPLKPIHLLLPGWRLRFFQPREPLELCFGRELGPPQYDLALLAERLRDSPATEVTLAPDGGAAGPDSAAGITHVFWGVLVAAVAGLLIVLARLLKSPADKPR
jgi:hypothetical protein